MTNTINIGDQAITVADAATKEIDINGKVYCVPSGVVRFISDLAQEVREQQRRRVATDDMIDQKITQRIDRILKALDARGLLAKDLKADYPLPANMEIDCGTWTFFDECREVAREGMKRNALEDLTEAIGGL